MRWWHIEDLLPLERTVFPDEPWTARLFWSELGQLDTRHYLVALAGEHLAGYAGLCGYPEEAFIQTMAVDPASQRQGVGTLLLRALLAEAARRDLRTVLLEVRADNAPARALYERHGFLATGVRRGYYQPSGTDAVVMERRA
ncbi:MAG: ribosomal protein S18-alanine N-acetyltransferase [Actinomycetota bacterium]|nr:ribosomal protein S18-alanine N-acetyltransferase [Actinomycetota bacterium]